MGGDHFYCETWRIPEVGKLGVHICSTVGRNDSVL